LSLKFGWVGDGLISKIVIENYRSIKKLEFEPKGLSALIGENNVGKSNILSAIDLLLGERWPQTKISLDDIYNRDTNLDVRIQIYFDSPLNYTYYGTDLTIQGFGLEYNFNSGAVLKCVNQNGSAVQTQYSKDLPMSNVIREKMPCVLISVSRDLNRELSGSQWTLLGKLLKDFEGAFNQDNNRAEDFKKKIIEACDLLRINSFNDLENILRINVKRLTGFVNADLKFSEPNVFKQYKSLELTVQESGNFDPCSALEMGSGIQSAIVIAIIQAYRELKKTGSILLIEEPEVYLHPHARRHFFHLLKELADQGNQVFYTTHSSEFVSLPDYETLNVVRKKVGEGTTISQVKSLAIPPASKEELKLLTQFDTQRNELFFARKVLLVEGEHERVVLPHLFALKDIDINEKGISIIDTRSKENLEFFIKVLKAFLIPFIVLHDEDRNANNYSTYHNGPNGINAKIRAAVGNSSLVFIMDPDFEGTLGLTNKDLREKLTKVRSLVVMSIPKVINDAIDTLINI
jgi:putative ATP-dependent endonuclease of OLD family